jgi:hypothetical protein
MQVLLLTCRPHFKPWVLYQLAKQEHECSLLVFDDCSKPTWPGVSIRPSERMRMTLGEKRQQLLDLVTDNFCWLDDDDWIPNCRFSMSQLLDTVDIVGADRGLFVDVGTLRTRRIELPPVVFNGAVFRKDLAKHKMQPVNRGEDTLWLQAVTKDSTVVSSPVMQHAWLSHDGNVTGKRGSMTFEGPKFQRFDSWELKFLSEMK